MSLNDECSTRNTSIKEEMNDETDSCFPIRKAPQLLFKRSIDQSDNCNPTTIKSISQKQQNHKSPAIIKQTKTSFNQIPNVKSVHSVSTTPTPNINKIADNLKSKQSEQNQPETTTTNNNKNNDSIPKVTLVNKVNQLTKSTSKTIYNDESLNKAYAHKLILHQLKQKQNELRFNNEDDDDDLTNLSWLTTFNISHFINPQNSLTLSPPKSPSSAPSSPNSLLNSTLDDEADCNSFHIKKDLKFSNQLLTNMLALNQSDDLTNKPAFTFSCLIFLAIESSARKRLSVKEIYAWISQTFVYYHNVPSGSWKNSIRHNLSFNKSFSKVDKNLLAMRDFSGKGSLWCVDSKIRPVLLDLFQKCSFMHSLDELNKSTYLIDINETSLKQQHQRQTDVSSNRKFKCSKSVRISSDSNLRSQQIKPIINPQIIAKLTCVQSKQVNVTSTVKSFSKSNSFNSGTTAQTSKSLSNGIEVSSELDAVKALLSMKSKANSMPVLSNTDENSCASKNRRKQMLKQPTKKCDDDEDEDVDVEEDYFIDEDDEFDESYSTQENDKSLNVNEDITDEDDDDDDDDDIDNENGKLKIDEDITDPKKDLTNNNPLLKLSRAAVIVEKDDDNDEPSKKKLKSTFKSK